MALTLGGRNTSFAENQQGAVDWVQLSNNTISASLAVFVRLIAADIDAQTLAVAHAIGGAFVLSDQGQNRVHNALKELKWCSSLGDVLHFGFGVQHPIRILAGTENGYATLVLSGALADLSVNFEPTAKILSELTSILGAPSRLRPSPRQWQALIKTCAGIFAATPFSCVYGHFLHLIGGDVTSTDVGNPKDVAKALDAVSKLSRGELKSINLTGNPTCCWIAAFGRWFFGLELEIRRADGTVLFRSVGDQSPVHITVVYGPSNVGENLQLVNTTYVIRDVKVLIRGSTPTLATGRIEWDRVLAVGFGFAGQALIKGKTSFSTILCSASRIFEAVRNVDLKLMEILRDDLIKLLDTGWDRRPWSIQLFENWIGYSEQSFGRGFLYFTQSCLPEIGNLEGLISGYPKISLSKAISDYEIELANLERLCCCSRCSHGPGWGEENDEACDICVPLLAESIIIMLWSLSIMSFDRKLCPTRYGLEEVYKQWAMGTTDEGRVARLLVWLSDVPAVSANAQALFAGSLHLPNPYWEPEGGLCQPAFYSCGMCFVVDTLIKISDRPDTRPYLHIIPGVVALDSGRQYSYVVESHNPTDDYEASNYEELTNLTLLKDSASPQLETELLVTESIDRLTLDLRFASSRGQVTGIGPAHLLHALLAAYGNVRCRDVKGENCQLMPPPYTSLYSVEGEGSINSQRDKEAGKRVVVRQLWGNTIARTIALLTNQTDSADSEHVGRILRVNECLPCCIRAALSRGQPLVYIIS